METFASPPFPGVIQVTRRNGGLIRIARDSRQAKSYWLQRREVLKPCIFLGKKQSELLGVDSVSYFEKMYISHWPI